MKDGLSLGLTKEEREGNPFLFLFIHTLSTSKNWM